MLHRHPLAVLIVLAGLAMSPAQAQGPAPRDARVVMQNGRPVLDVDDERLAPMFYALTDVPGGRWSWEELPQHNLQQFCRQGVRLYQVDVFFDHVWMPDGSLDLEIPRKQIRGVLDVCPEASVVFRFHVTAPKWWAQQHPEEWVAYADKPEGEYDPEQPFGFPRIIENDLYAVERVSLASARWRGEATEKLRDMLTELAATPEGNALIGVQVANGMYGEWHDWGFFYNEPDVGRPMLAAFRDWLRATYGSNAELQRAWNNPRVTLATATLPDLADRATTHGIFRDPQQEQRTIDYFTAKHVTTAETILHFARTVKETWPRPIVTGTFYGYYFSTFGRQAVGGHIELERILTSPDIDYLSGPQAYEPETSEPGDAYRSRSLLTSIRHNGKLWLDEMDFEVGIPRWRDPNYTATIRQATALLRRNVAFTFLKGQGLWFYDFGPSGVDLDRKHNFFRGSHGYWDHPVFLSDIAAMRELFQSRLDEPYTTGADVLFVYDTQSLYHTASLSRADPVSPTLIDHSTLNAFRSGVVFDPIHLEDLDTIDLSPYRTVVFGNVFYLTEAQRAMIRQRVATDGRHLIWVYAPGYTDGTRLDPGYITDVTGIQVSPTTIDEAPTLELATAGGAPYTTTLGSAPIAPLFAVTDPDAEAIATYAQTGEVAVARKTLADHTAWYLALPSKDPTMLRTLLHRTPAHRYTTEATDVMYAGNGIVLLHSVTGGDRTVTLRNGTTVDLFLPSAPTTLLLDAETGESLLATPDMILPPPPESR